DLGITGNDANNILTGNAGDNLLDGGVGNDTLVGGAGDDISIGGAGNDTLRNSPGSDRLSGGLGADRFTFSTELKSDLAKSLFDYILDFNRAEGDLIDLKAIDADTGVAGNQAFTLVREGPGFLGGAGEISFVQFEQNGTLFTNIYGNTDADPDVDFVIGLVGTFDLTAQDFLL
ncbi:MAG: M10 family metallopeptidase C-terminal domain-containing protein, partial [Sandaracinobacteroides sp.]